MQKCFLIAIWFASTSACADIVQSSHNENYATYFYRPLGQSFTATMSESQVRAVSVLTGEIINPQLSDPTITLQLRNGIGYAGSVVGSQTLPSIPKSTPPFTWIDFAFASALALTPGQTYTLEFSATNVDKTALSYAASHNNPYPGGTLILSEGFPEAQSDLAFRVLAVPEPTGYALCMIIGMTLMLCRPRSTARK
jgi:hypothetical protein